MNPKTIYEVRTIKKNKCLFSGIREEVMRELGKTENQVYWIVTSSKIFSYKGEDCCIVRAAKVKKAKNSKFKEQLDMIKWHLDVYGNTVSWVEPKKYIEALEKDGYFVESRHVPKKVIHQKHSTNISDIFYECWILTLIKKEPKEVSND